MRFGNRARCPHCRRRYVTVRVTAQWRVPPWHAVSHKHVCTGCTLNALHQQVVLEMRPHG